MIQLANTIVTLECNTLTGLPTVLFGDEDHVESGDVYLIADQEDISVVFLTPKANGDYTFDEGYFSNYTDVDPATIGYVPTAKSNLGFTLHLDPAPTTDNYIFHWKVRI